MKVFFFILLITAACGLFAAPLEGGYALAPRPSASEEEKIQAYVNARLKVIEEAKKYEGAPYRYGGLNANGLDCSGLLVLTFRESLGVSIPRSASGLYSWVVRIPIERAQPGDLVFFRTGTNNNITHVGLYLGNRRFIHSASAGAVTGVIYSTLDEQYYANTFAGAGRAFPEAPVGFNANTSSTNNGSGSGSQDNRQVNTGNQGSGGNNLANDFRFLAGAAFAPIFNGFFTGGDIFRGFTSQLYIGTENMSPGMSLSLGLELRPEYDGTLGVFRLPITLSLGVYEKYRFFIGPVLSFGDASISVNGEQRNYLGGTSWLGTFGLAYEPVSFKLRNNAFLPYLEAAWQSYYSENSNFNLAADFSASFRFSAGLKWKTQIWQ
ncbi:MAG: C40 family peptidase [Treponema sp.]|nr:C40 family peptidase [Treponema sp.]